MSLRSRLTLLSLALTVATVAGFGAVAYGLFVRQQDRQMRELLTGELGRVAALLAQPQLGASFRGEGDGSSILQFVTRDGRIVQGFGAADPIPVVNGPHVMRLDGRPYLVGVTSWPATGGTIRMGLDVTGALDARRRLLGSLLVAGALMGLAVALVGLVATRRALKPLQGLARASRALDARAPEDLPYRGPDDEVNDLARALNQALGRIRHHAAEERAFLVEVAHELAGPLTLVAYHLDAARSELPDHARLRTASEAARELLRTSQDLLVLARGELDRPLTMSVCDLAEVVRRLADEYPGVRARVEGETEVVGDRERLMQAARNLVRNGVQAAGATQRVRLELRGTQAEVVLAVSDEGPGMAPDLIERIERGAPSRREPAGGPDAAATDGPATVPATGAGDGSGGERPSGGAGVGLGIAQRIVAQHGGTLQAASEPGRGTRVTLRLPSLASRLEPDEGASRDAEA